MRAKTVTANREPQTFSCAARSVCQPSNHRIDNRRGKDEERTASRAAEEGHARSRSPCSCVSDQRGEAGTIAFRFCA